MNRKIKLLGVVAALLTQCLALHALTEEDIATLDAAFEATFREGPTGGMGVWTELATNTTAVAGRLGEAPLPSAPLPSEKMLVAEFGEGLAVETVNAALLPRLVPFGVIAVTPGRSLEEAYLGK